MYSFKSNAIDPSTQRKPKYQLLIACRDASGPLRADRVHELIAAGADVNISDKQGKTALFYAVQQRNNKGVVRALITAGADVNITNDKGKTVLFYAVQHFKNECVGRALIAGAGAGAGLNKSEDKETALLNYVVQKSDNDSVVRALIDAGIELNKTDNEGKTALFYAVQQSNNERAVPPLNDADAARKLFDISVVDALISGGADVNMTDNEGKTALMYAIQDNNETVACALIDAGADVNKTDEEGKTALMYAIQEKRKTVVLALIDAGVDVNITDNEKKTALLYAVQQRNERMVRALVDAGALLNEKDHYGRTPLFFAATTELASLAVFLLKKGANMYLEENYSVLTFIIEECFEFPSDLHSRLNILIKEGVVKKKQIFEAIISVAFCKCLCFDQSGGIDANSLCALLKLAHNYTSKTDFLSGQAIKKIRKTIKEQQKRKLIEPESISKILRGLINLGANPNCVDSDGNTALHHAIQLSTQGVPLESVLKICKELREMGASLNIKNLRNETPLLYCLASTIKKISSHGCRHWSEVKTLLDVWWSLAKHWSDEEEMEQSTALHLLLELLRQVILDVELRKKGVDELTELVSKLVSVFKAKASVVCRDNNGNTPLHLWAKLALPPGQDYSIPVAKGYTFQDLLKRIFDHFRDNKVLLHVKNENGETPLHLCRTWAAVELMIDAGANSNDVDSSGRTPLFVAAKNSQLVMNQRSLYPDVLLQPVNFWKKVLERGLDPWTVDIQDESVMSVLMKSASHDLVKALIDVACEDWKVRSRPLILFSLLTAVCRDKLCNARWKLDAVRNILSLTKCPVNGNEKQDSPLHYCCRNIVEKSKSLRDDEIKTTVDWSMVQLLRSFGADCRIPDSTGQWCLDIAKGCPPLKNLLMEPIDLDMSPIKIKAWRSVSKSHERCLVKVARHHESVKLDFYFHHENPVASGSFGSVFVGINEKDGREVAIKRAEKIRMQRSQYEREIKNLTALADCEHVVRYLHFLEDEHFSYIVLELMEGNLDQFLNSAIQMDTKVSICKDVVQGLKYLHNHRILHRDLKPTNILYKTYPKLCLKIADFGLSRRIDRTSSSTVYGTGAGTRCWIAPEVLMLTKCQHSKASDMFSCGLVLHYILSLKKHPFSPKNCANKGALQICAETETNIIHDKKEDWDDSLSPEAANLIEQLLVSDASKRATAAELLAHPLFWSSKKKLELFTAVGNQPEFECPRARRPRPLTAVETDLETSFGAIVKYMDWNDPGYVYMPAIYTEMTKKRKGYDTHSIVELVRFMRNAIAHVSESTRPTPVRKHLLEDFVFLEYFPSLVMEVYKAVATHGWDQSREEIKYVMEN